MDSEDGLSVLRHSCAHVLAQAVQQVNPSAKLGIGPPIRDGFYYDFDVESRSARRTSRPSRRSCSGSSTRARPSCAARSPMRTPSELAAEPYKCELVSLKGAASEDAAEGASVEVGGAQLTIYDNLRRDGSRAWGDLCRGPHIPTTKLLGNAFKVMRSAAAYWRGDQANQQSSASMAPRGRPRTSSPHTSTGSPRPRSATTASWAPSSTCSPSPTSSAPVGRSSTPRVAWSSGRWRTTSGGGTSRRASTTSGPPHLQGGPLPHLRAPALLRGHDVPADGVRGLGLLPQADELPDAQPHLSLAWAVLP
jgi:hypothetical protein